MSSQLSKLTKIIYQIKIMSQKSIYFLKLSYLIYLNETTKNII